MSKLTAHLFIFLTIVFAVYSQVIIKWQVNTKTAVGGDQNKFQFILSMFQNPWVLSGIAATFISGVTWMLAMTRLDLSYGYIFMSLVFVLVPTAGYLFFNEPITSTKIIGAVMIMAGVCVVSIGATS